MLLSHWKKPRLSCFRKPHLNSMNLVKLWCVLLLPESTEPLCCTEKHQAGSDTFVQVHQQQICSSSPSLTLILPKVVSRTHMDASFSVRTSPLPTFINLTVLNPRIPTANEYCKFPRRFHIRSLSQLCVCVFVGGDRGFSGPHTDDWCAWEHTSLWL